VVPRIEAEVIRMPASLPPPSPGRTRMVVLGPRPQILAPTPHGVAGAASSVGIIATGGTNLTMTPADLSVTPRTDISDFRLVTLDAGSY
jgi:hypothetical protein